MNEQEIEKLIARNKELEAKLAELTQKPAHGLDPATWNVLDYLAGISRPLVARQVAGGCGIAENIAKYHLGMLVGINLVRHERIPVMEFGADDIGYSITNLGTGFHMKHR